MLQPSSISVTSPRPQFSGADRRAHPRIRSAKLGITRVDIRNRESASLVDLSSGGALLELPYQLSPVSRVAVQLNTAGERLEVPLQLLRCYVVDLKGGVTYHAAGAFDNLLNLEALAMRASSAMQRLMISLERLERATHKTTQSRSGAQFYETLTDLISWLRRSESLDLVILKLKARLTQTYRSLLVIPSTSPTFDRATSLECFGLTFKAKQPLSAYDRRFLKANAQLISILEEARRELRDEDACPAPSQVLHSAADWLASQSELRLAQSRPRRAPIAQPVAKAPREPIVESDETDYFTALILDPGFA